MITFTFTVNPKTNEAVFSGNITMQEALQVLQQLVIADAITKAKELDKKSKDDKIDAQTEKEVKDAGQ